MVRIVGVEIPDERKVPYALTKIHGVGKQRAYDILRDAGIDFDKRVKDLTDQDVLKIQKQVESFPTEGILRKRVRENIQRLKRTGTYRGARHAAGLPVRGQRTRTNARTKRGRRQTVGAFKKDMLTKMGQEKKKAPTKTGEKK